MGHQGGRWLWVVIGLCCLPLIAHLYLGLANRALADDYCFTAQARTLGVLGNVAYMYHNWTGTYASTFFQSVVGLNRAWWLVPIVLLVAWWCALVWLGRQMAFIAPLKQISVRVASILFAIVALYGVVTGTANIFQSLYWTSGAITYTTPIILLTLNIGFILFCLRREQRSPVAHALVAAFCLLAGGFSPLYAVFQTTFFMLAGVIIFFLPNVPWVKRARGYVFVAFSAALVALLILAVAPGNAIRQAAFENRLSWLGILFYTIRATALFLPTSAGYFSPFALLLPLFMGASAGVLFIRLDDKQRQYFRRRGLRWIMAVFLLGHVLIASCYCYFTSLYSIWDLPPARAYIIPQYILVAMMIAIGVIAGMGLQWEHQAGNRWALNWMGRILIGATLVLGPVPATLNLLTLGDDFSIYAREWDAQDARLRQLAAQQSQARAIVAPYTVDMADYVDVKPLSPIASDNHCVASYYGLAAIRVYQPSASGG